MKTLIKIVLGFIMKIYAGQQIVPIELCKYYISGGSLIISIGKTLALAIWCFIYCSDIL